MHTIATGAGAHAEHSVYIASKIDGCVRGLALFMESIDCFCLFIKQ